MRRLSTALFFLLAFMGLAGPARGEGTTIFLKASFFSPTDEIFRDVYGNGMALGGDVTMPLRGVPKLQLWAGTEIFGRTGTLSVSQEKTKVCVIPLFAGLRGRFGKERIRPYVGIAAAYFLLHETNPLGAATDGGLGLLTQAGIMVRLRDPFGLDIFAGYRACSVRTGGDDPLKADLGGFSAGLGLAYRF